MKLRIKWILYFLPLLGLLTVSCLDDFNKDNDPMYYTPSFSIPIGPLSYSLQDIMPPEVLDLPVLDTSLIADSIPLIIYDDILFFVNPMLGYDTILTGDMNLSAISPNMEYASSLMFRMNYINEIPVNMAFQMYFYNGSRLVDSLFEDGKFWVAQAIPESEGNLTVPISGREEIYVDTTMIQEMLQVNNYELYIHVETYSEGLDKLHLYSYYGFDLQLALRAALLVPFE